MRDTSIERKNDDLDSRNTNDFRDLNGSRPRNIEILNNRLSWILAGVVFLFSFIVYAMTSQVTTSFWDCGEFISTSYILGVPHPPGAPLMNLVYRLAAILPIPGEIAWRVNLASGFFNALGIGVLFLIIARVLSRWFVRLHDWGDIFVIMTGATIGSLLAAFSSTYWFNGIEAEVYGPAMFCTNLVVYLSLIWSEHHKTPKSDRYLILIAFILYLAISVHLTVMIMLPPLFLFFIIMDENKRKSPIFWFTWFVLFSVAISFDVFVVMFIAGLVIFLAGFLFTKKKNFLIGFLTVLVAVMGFSVNTYTFVRSRANPIIDENNPETLDSFKDYINRKQYGSDSMWEKMFKRRAKWSNQVGTHRRMGFWGFYYTQYTQNPKETLFGLIPFILALVGMAAAFTKTPKRGSLLFMSVLISTLGLIIYINFADGTVPPDHLEVRDRDYFYTPGYMYLSMFTGIGIAWLLYILNKLRRDGKLGSWITIAIAIPLMVLLPAVPLKANWFNHDRGRNWIPRDYAYNILMSVEKNGILFTNGDNDTFPLWFLQAVEGVRTDVCVANLSLLNTQWYIHQLKAGQLSEQEGLKITLTDEQINKLHAFRDRDNNVVRVQDILIDHLIKNAEVKMDADSNLYFDPPIYFAVTVAPDNKLSYDPYLKMTGLAYKLVTTRGERQVDTDLMAKNLYEVYEFRGLTDSTIHKDENSTKLLQNYITAFMTLAMSLEQEGDSIGAIECMQKALETIPYRWELTAFAGDIYSRHGRRALIDELYEEGMKLDPSNQKLNTMFAHFYKRLEDDELFLKVLKDGYKRNPNDRDFMLDLVKGYYQLGDRDSMQSILNGWKDRFPEDKELRNILSPTKPTVIQPTDAAGNPKVISPQASNE